MSEQNVEYAEANYVSVMETNVLHASDVVYWLDGSSATDTEQMSRIEIPLEINISEKPRDARVLHSVGKSAVWRTPTEPMVDGRATEEQRTRPAQTPFSFAGEAWDRSRRFNPVSFSLSLGSGLGHAVVTYPTPLGVKKSPAGILFGRLINASNGNPVLWGILELEVRISVSETLLFRAQSDEKGDFILSLKGLPPLPESETEFNARLTVTANFANEPLSPPDTSTYVNVNLESINNEGQFVSPLPLQVRPGERGRINSAEKEHLLLQTI